MPRAEYEVLVTGPNAQGPIYLVFGICEGITVKTRCITFIHFLGEFAKSAPWIS